MALRLLFAVFGTAAYLGLAILGGGGFSDFFSHPARVAVAIATLAMSIVALFTSGNLSAGVQEDRGNRWVLAAFSAIGLLDGWLPAFTDRKDIWTIDGDTTRWIGMVLFVLGGALRMYPVFVLGRRFSGLVAIQRDHTLVTDGIYGVIRNPSYLGLLINALGWALVFRAGTGVLLAALTIVPLVARIRAEERLLQMHFRDQYNAYCARTWRLIPGLY